MKISKSSILDASSHSLLLFVAVVLLGAVAVQTSVPCALRETQHGHVCVCNATYCDYLDDPTPQTDSSFVVVSSSKGGLRLDTTNGHFNYFMSYFILDYDLRVKQNSKTAFNRAQEEAVRNERASITRDAVLNIDRATQYQKIVGFGGSLTGAVSYILDKLPQALQDNIYESYFSDRGIGYNLLRTPIGGCDFDLAPWAYNEEPENDPDLTNFKELDPRDRLKIEQIKRLKAVSQVENLRIKGAAWSSPKWMKSNNDWTGYSHLKKEYYQAWADYHLKWVELMVENGLPIWAISTGNEPMNGVLFMYFVRFMSLGWTPSNQAIWLNDHLGPTIRNSKYKDLIIFGNDDQRYTFPTWFNKMKSTRPDSVDYLNGLAVHWYWDEIFQPTHIERAVAEMPDKILITSESCIGDKPWQKAAPLLGSWERGEKYARAFLQDLQHHFNGWIDWNLVLDEQGGPNYVDNTVDAPVIANMTSLDEIYKQPIFYTMGQFSKFIPEGSVRIDAVRSNVNIDSVAFLRPDNTVCAVILNTGNAPVRVTVVDSVNGAIVLIIPERSIHTLLYK